VSQRGVQGGEACGSRDCGHAELRLGGGHLRGVY
jgi:hypothetical protein